MDFKWELFVIILCRLKRVQRTDEESRKARKADVQYIRDNATGFAHRFNEVDKREVARYLLRNKSLMLREKVA